MKSFAQILTESEKTFEFKIKVAGVELTDEAMDRLEHALKTYDLDSISKPKRLPMQNSLDFPSMGPVEVYVMDVVLKYPVNDAQLRQTVHDQAFIPLASIIVVPKNHPEELRRDEEAEAAEKNEGKTPESILLKDVEDTGVKGEDFHSEKATDSFLKGLETRKYEFATNDKEKFKDTNAIPQGTTSPISGARQGK